MTPAIVDTLPKGRDGEAGSVRSVEWRPVLGFEGVYEVSNDGSVRSITRWVRGRIVRGRARKPIIDRYGYATLLLSNDGVATRRKVHRLVCEAFNGPCPPNKEVAHLDGDKTNNAASNLVWASRLENMAHRFGDGPRGIRKPQPPRPRSERALKVNAERAAEIRDAYSAGLSQRSIARRFQVSQTYVCHIINGRTRAKGSQS